MWEQELQKRALPEVWPSALKSPDTWRTRRLEIIELLCHEFAGFAPSFTLKSESVAMKCDTTAYGGKATVTDINIAFSSPFNNASFPCKLAIPNHGSEPFAVFATFSFTPSIADGLGEEIIDSGYAIANVYYQDIAPDQDDNFENGLGRFCTRNPYNSWGKLAIWAYGMSRVADYLCTLPQLDSARFGVIGHSRLGKAALLCGALDERFSFVAANESGGGGAALFRGKTGESIKNLAGSGSRGWFCGNFFQYLNNEASMPFDQHFLLSLIAPRHLYIASAQQDTWADPRSEFLACVAASGVFEALGVKGLCMQDAWPIPNVPLHEGNIGYHLRSGTHFFSRDDWRHIISYRQLHDC